MKNIYQHLQYLNTNREMNINGDSLFNQSKKKDFVRINR